MTAGMPRLCVAPIAMRCPSAPFTQQTTVGAYPISLQAVPKAIPKDVLCTSQSP